MGAYKDYQSDIEKEYVYSQISMLLGKGKSGRQISIDLHLPLNRVQKIIRELREQAKENVKRYVNDELSFQYENTLSGINLIVERVWSQLDHIQSQRDINNAMGVLLQAYGLRLELLSSNDVLKQAVTFVDSQLKNKQEDDNIIENIDEIKNQS